ncbi:MAG: hypothetical protein M3Y49_15865 [Actinomycetota bacterium]|nr:hypothetical protein [Actinomycetota bacterium]
MDILQLRDSVLINIVTVFNIVNESMFAPFLLLAPAGLIWWRWDRVSAAWFYVLAVTGWFLVSVATVLVHRRRGSGAPRPRTDILRTRTLVPFIGLSFLVVVTGSRLVLGAHYRADVTAAPIIVGGAVLAISGPALLVQDRFRGWIDLKMCTVRALR